ncbi:hypothetical protein H310_14019 [Aphanomyces invadans]|uniref:PH domain-containing protein n=1 Tax=Aphanomyces invadans TaxID=157072 RepID=A0A024TBH5_9STRA|nr:hypothetical protein H310_14019 [Aphanomyces invadans]ETV91500.1 hypothetical protein H310_14019 [Aphanomyces invadans]|eukprot:XP_008879952.1 hypothetical protein H310_14019 [Aphanomyces invadans]
MRGNGCNPQPLAQVNEEGYEYQYARDSILTGSAAPSMEDLAMFGTASADPEAMTETSSEPDTDDDKRYESQYMSLGQQYGARSKQKRQERRMQELLDVKMQSFNGVSRGRGTSITDPVRHTFTDELPPPVSSAMSSSSLNSSRASMVMGPVLQSMARRDVNERHRRASMRSFEGWLLKRGQRVKNWKRRYFTLNGQELKYMEGPGAKPKGYGMVVGVKKLHELPYALSISIVPNRTLDVQAESTDEQEAWMQRILDACGHVAATTPPPPPVLHVTLSSAPATPPQQLAASLQSTLEPPRPPTDLNIAPPSVPVRRTSSLSSRSSTSHHESDYGIQSSLDTATTCEGWLYKQGSLVKNWKKRWFTLLGEVLSYRDMQSSVAIKGYGRVQSVQRCMTTHAFGLLIELDNNRKLHVYAEDGDTQKRWYRAIAQVLQPTATSSEGVAGSGHAPLMSANQTLFKQSKTHGGYIKNFSGWMSVPSGLFNASWTRCFFTLHGVELAQSDDTPSPVVRVGVIQKVVPWEGKPGGLEFHLLGQKNVWRTLCPSIRAANAWMAAIEDCQGRTRYTVDKFLRSCDAKKLPTIMCGWLTKTSTSSSKKHASGLRQYYVLRHLTLSVAADVDLPPQEIDVVTAILLSDDHDCALVFKFSTAPTLVLECDSVESWTRWQRIVRTCLKETHRANYILN